MCEGGQVGIYVNIEVGKEEKEKELSTPHEHMGCSKDSIQLHVRNWSDIECPLTCMWCRGGGCS